MRNLLLVTACVLISACSQPVKVIPQVEPLDYIVNNDCYTVDLFTEVKIEKPDANISAANRQFLGEWGGGAWNDVWCHGLLVNKVYADGRVEDPEPHAVVGIQLFRRNRVEGLTRELECAELICRGGERVVGEISAGRFPGQFKELKEATRGEQYAGPLRIPIWDLIASGGTPFSTRIVFSDRRRT